MKYIQIKFLLIVACAGLFSACNSTKATNTETNKNVNSVQSNKPTETPTPTPKMETNINTENKDTTIKETKTENSVSKTSESLNEKITKANFEKIENGMTLDEVGKIFNDKGMLVSDATINGRHTLTYMWATDDMKKRIRVTFEKDKVVEKVIDGF